MGDRTRRSVWRDAGGVTIIEYALIAGLITLAAVAGWEATGGSLGDAVFSMSRQLDNAIPTAATGTHPAAAIAKAPKAKPKRPKKPKAAKKPKKPKKAAPPKKSKKPKKPKKSENKKKSKKHASHKKSKRPKKHKRHKKE